MQDEQIASVSFYSGLADSFQDTISSLSFVVVVLVIAAGLLAFVVLYNLTNVNISERIREIATIKVLGFYDREGRILCIPGYHLSDHHRCLGRTAPGHRSAQPDHEPGGDGERHVRPQYRLAVICDLIPDHHALLLCVNLFMYRKLMKVQMVESLKSVE